MAESVAQLTSRGASATASHTDAGLGEGVFGGSLWLMMFAAHPARAASTSATVAAIVDGSEPTWQLEDVSIRWVW